MSHRILTQWSHQPPEHFGTKHAHMSSQWSAYSYLHNKNIDFTPLPFYLFTLKRLAKLHILFNTCKDIPHKQEKNTTFAMEIFINARI